MPASPADAEDLARAVGRIYQDAEAALLEILARALAEGIESPRWAEAKLWAIGDVRRAVEELTTALQHDADGAIGRAIREAYARGGQAAVAELGMLPEGQRAAALRALPGARNADRLANEALDDTRPIYRRILRAVPDAYRNIVQRVSGSVLLGGLTRRQATQRALDQLAARGITGFVDRRGRNWEMAAYAEMAVRSVAGRAAIQGHVDRLEAVGQELVIVSDAPLECPLCRPWEGEVLAINGQSGPHTLVEEHAIKDGQPVVVHVAGSLPEARAAGLFHCNCRHSLSLYLPGVTTRPKSPPHPGGATYEDTQQQRYLERQVRQWKRRQAAALNDDARRLAGVRIRAYQARIRELTAEKGLPRKRQREQVGTAR
ncbi:minor capsid protein 2 [Streptomyces sp. TLI_235]|nr:phage minor capsid protein [Streptomyces sp. TLI_235]PBC80121.1 minor capsid protein 2 [Streptomyces sp. TLI_235]